MIINNKHLLRIREYSRARAHAKALKHWMKLLRAYYRPLTTTQKKEIQDYYMENYGKKVKTLWHQFYYSVNNTFSVEYIPEDIFFNKAVYYLNEENTMPAYSDKNIYDKLFRESGVVQPRTILKNIHGLFYQKGNIITTEEAEKICANLDRVIIKPALDSGAGKNVICFSSINGSTDYKNLSVRRLLEIYEKNFIIQEKVSQHPLLSSLNKSSLNTFRVNTYRSFSDIVVLNCVLKVGKQGEIMDNALAGGCFVGVDIENSILKKHLYSVQNGAISEKTESGVVLDGLHIPFANDIFQAACSLHKCLPYARLVGWDISANDKNEVVLIEGNINGVGCANIQMASGPFFGKYTKHILNSIRGK